VSNLLLNIGAVGDLFPRDAGAGEQELVGQYIVKTTGIAGGLLKPYKGLRQRRLKALE
jgi:hypothetical protein